MNCIDNYFIPNILKLCCFTNTDIKRSTKPIDFRKVIMDVDQSDGKEVKVVEEESAPKKPETDDSNAGATSPPPTTSETSSLASSDNKNDKKEPEKTEEDKYEESSVQVNANENGTVRANSTSPIPASSNGNSKNIKRSMSDRNVLNGQGIDAHPYARGSVIEVVYNLPANKDENDDDELEEAYLAEEDDDFEQVTIDAEENTEKKQAFEVRLADIIDRAPSKTPNHEIPCYRWRYYIHYRDYNRRMDEWITDPTRIVSPPSVGNAKVRAIKKEKMEEEKRKREREQAQLLENASKRRQTSDDSVGRPVSQRASSRRASAAIAASSSQSITTPAVLPNDTSQIAGQKDGPLDDRLTRSQRRRRGTTGDQPEESQKKDFAPNTVVTTLIPEAGEIIKDKVLTVAAQELDEHEGLDEASLREHEEGKFFHLLFYTFVNFLHCIFSYTHVFTVTKVKNVHEVELGKYQMVSGH